MRRILEDAAMGLPCDTEDPVYLENGGLVDLENMADAESSIKRSGMAHIGAVAGMEGRLACCCTGFQAMEAR